MFILFCLITDLLSYFLVIHMFFVYYLFAFICLFVTSYLFMVRLYSFLVSLLYIVF